MTAINEKYKASERRWYQWRNSQKVDPIQGYCNWEHDFGNFKIECWNVQDRGPVIFQFWPNRNGFNEYVSLTKAEEAAPGLLIAAINMLKNYRDEALNGGLAIELKKAIEEATS